MQHGQCVLSALDLDIQEIFHLMGYRDTVPPKEILSLVETIYVELDKICHPQYIYRAYDGYVCDNNSVIIGYQVFKTGKIITQYLNGMEKCCVFATTAGWEYETYKEQLRKEGNLLGEFIADTIGSLIAEACVNKVTNDLSASFNYDLTYPYSPGYCGWELTEQQLLFSLLPDNPCGITLTESSFMLPVKSISGIIGIGKKIKQKKYACHICESINCYKRKEF